MSFTVSCETQETAKSEKPKEDLNYVEKKQKTVKEMLNLLRRLDRYLSKFDVVASESAFTEEEDSWVISKFVKLHFGNQYCAAHEAIMKEFVL